MVQGDAQRPDEQVEVVAASGVEGSAPWTGRRTLLVGAVYVVDGVENAALSESTSVAGRVRGKAAWSSSSSLTIPKSDLIFLV